jgi:hypothetical protein
MAMLSASDGYGGALGLRESNASVCFALPFEALMTVACKLQGVAPSPQPLGLSI